MKLTDFLDQTNLNDSLLIGYYGGGNYGDELLLEVLGNLLLQRGARNVVITYQDPEQYLKYHHDFGYSRVDMRRRGQLLKQILKQKNILIGGGGLWGVDMNFNTLVLSLMLFAARFGLRKKVYLLGVGYYNSTNTMGRIAAWFAGKAARVIIARDCETLDNFGRINSHTYLDSDMAWHIDKTNLFNYQLDAAVLEEKLPIHSKTLLVALRRPQSKAKGQEFIDFTKTVGKFIRANPGRPIVVALLESETKSPEEYALARFWAQDYPNVRLLDFPINPLALYMYFQKHRKQLTVIGPQFHIIITAHLTDVPFAPLVYDNKVSALFDQIGITEEERIPVKRVKPSTLQTVADNFYGGKA